MHAPLARTDQEAEIYIEMTPCHRCGGHGFTGSSEVIFLDAGAAGAAGAAGSAGEDLGTRWTGTCTRCGVAREFVFRLPAEVAVGGTAPYDFGPGGPSELLDPGQWMTVADLASRPDPEPDPPLALAALDEVAKFIPADADEVPAEAFHTDEGRKAYRQNPGRFTRRWLEEAAAALRRDAG
jgi:hypothetical protein